MPTASDPIHEDQLPCLHEEGADELLAPAAEPHLILRPGVHCLQRWMDLNA